MPVFSIPVDKLPYDPTDQQSILAWAQSLVGKTLREVAGELEVPAVKGTDKGSFGKLLETIAFLYEPNSDEGPDLPDAGVEIKSLPLEPDPKDSTRLRPKERLQLHNINYLHIVDENWETCTLRKKCSLMLVVADEYVSKDVSGLDKPIVNAFYLPFPIPKDEPTIRADWEYVKAKVLAGKAEEISSSDTTFLDVAPHGQGKGKDATPQPRSDEPAKRRGFALKKSYMDTVYRLYEPGGPGRLANDIPQRAGEGNLTLEQLVKKRYEPYVGMTWADIADALELGIGGAKDRLARVASAINNGILGVSGKGLNDEYARAGYIVRNPNFEADGRLIESVSFPHFRVDELLAETDWYESLFRSQIAARFCATVWQKEPNQPAQSVLRGVVFFGIPDSVVDTHGRAVWERTREALRSSDMEALPKTKDDPYFHVRPHANKNQPPMILPDGTPATKQCFWIRNIYFRNLILDTGIHIEEK